MKVELENVRKRFGKVEALRGVTFSLESGSRAVLVGPNGSGKSTLLRALLGLIACEGLVSIDGRSPFRDRLLLARKLGYVPQIAPRIAAPVKELVWATAKVRELEPSRIAQVALRLDLPLEPIANRSFRDLSGGMKQKLLIALAMAAPAGLLVLDEPTASLDPASRDRFDKLLDERAENATVLFCSHHVEDLRRYAQRVLWLREGSLGEESCPMVSSSIEYSAA